MKAYKAYKALSRDLKCRGFQYEEGQTYELEGNPVLCSHGFHFCKDLVLTLAYYPVSSRITENCYAEVEILGEVEFEEPTKHKGVTNKIKVLRIIPDTEVTALIDGYRNSGDSNSGNRNSGDWNSGDWNSGYSNSGDSNSGDSNSGNSNSGRRNSGYRNSGDRNSGDRNSGDWNSGDWNSGFFNTDAPDIIRVFNKDCPREEWNDADKPEFLYFDIDEELGYKGSFKKSWEESDTEDRERVKELPNFDANLFYEISGIDLRNKER